MNIQSQINLYEAKAQLSSLIKRAVAGEDIVIAKNGKPMARLVPMPASNAKRKIPWGDLGKHLTPGQRDRIADAAMLPLPADIWDGARREGWPPTRAR